MNKVLLIGRLTKDADVRILPDGTPLVKWTLAVDRPYTNKQGEKDADFIRCALLRKGADKLAAGLTKGRMIGVEGSYQTRSWEEDGKKNYMVEVKVDQVTFADSKKQQDTGW